MLIPLFAVIPVSAMLVSPDVQITSPVSEFATNQNSLTVEYTFSAHKDNPGEGALGSVSLIELLINGEVVQTKDNPPQAKEGSGSFEIELNIPDQILNIQTCAYQGDIHAGLKGCSEEVRVIVDKTPPEITLIDVPPLYTNNPRPFFKIDYRDNLSGIEHVKVSLNGDEVTEGLNIIEGGLFYQPLIDLEDGSYISEIEVKDKAGNTATSSVTFTIDTVPPEPPSISIDKIKEANPGVEIDETEGRIIITLRGSQDRVTFVGEESEPGNRIIIYAPSPLIVGEVEYTQSYRVEISGIIEGEHIVKIIEQDQAGNESVVLEVEIDRFIQEIVDFSDIKVEINKRWGIFPPIIPDWSAPPGSDEELIEIGNRIKDITVKFVIETSGEDMWEYTCAVPRSPCGYHERYWPTYYGSIPNIEGLIPSDIKDVYEGFVKKLEWVPAVRYYTQNIRNFERQGYPYGPYGYGVEGWGGNLEEALRDAERKLYLGEFIPMPYTSIPTYEYGTWVIGRRYSDTLYYIWMGTVNYRGEVYLSPYLYEYYSGFWYPPIEVIEYQVSTIGRFNPGWQYIEFIDNTKEIPPEPPIGCYYFPVRGFTCASTANFRYWHSFNGYYARIIPPDVEIEKIEITPNPEEGEEAVNVCFLSEQQFTAYAYMHLKYTDGSKSNTFKIRLPLTSNIGIIDADGTFVAIESGEGEITANYGGVSESVKVNVVKVDLNIYNGKNGSKVDEIREETEGVIILVNRDDDNENLVPDYEEPSEDRGFKEDDPARLEIILEPGLNRGLLRLEATGGKEKIRVWESGLYQTQEIILPKTWDLSIETIPLILWVEGIKKSDSVRDVGLKVTYQKGNFSCEDKVKATVVLVYEGYAVYRELDIPLVEERGHTGILVKYKGNCTKGDIENDANYDVIEMANSGPRRLNLATGGFKQSGRVYWGTYTSSDLTDTKSLKIAKNAEKIIEKHFEGEENRIEYNMWDVLGPSPWDGTISTIEELRCDGLVEACYEMAGVMVWGKKVGAEVHYDIVSYLDEHNETLSLHDIILPDLWYKYLYPATQCGRRNEFRDVYWNTKFSQYGSGLFKIKPYEPNLENF